ncbi:ABC-2 type transport system permease protein [Nakamurella panacisegetis]|uniref:Transport permease protein n=1 Tax=Nakamurella panacisegetis TaxID=1090615 RepID=A0A1H0IWK9_9ACTN|nr:ABC transporter permease [Nakamurella panacisegetis]SDO35847.1 ABC-2 type transport system permease protein [Nakamurella panacisegetis]
MSTVGLTLSQARYVNKAFWRNPARVFFTFAFPLMLLVIFTSLLGNGTVLVGSSAVKESTYYVAAMAAFAVIQACYSNIASSVTAQRDAGILKRIDGSPLPKGPFMGSRILHSVVVAVMLVLLTAAFGRAFYSSHIPTGTAIVEFLVMLVIGSASFCALGLAITAVIPNADASAPVVFGTVLPLCFVSGIFIPFGNSAPNWILWVGRIFPIKHFANGVMAGFLGTPFDWWDVLVVALWGAAGVLFAVRRFSWEPRTG